MADDRRQEILALSASLSLLFDGRDFNKVVTAINHYLWRNKRKVNGLAADGEQLCTTNVVRLRQMATAMKPHAPSDRDASNLQSIIDNCDEILAGKPFAEWSDE